MRRFKRALLAVCISVMVAIAGSTVFVLVSSSPQPTKTSVIATVNKAAGITTTTDETVQLNTYADSHYVYRINQHGLQVLVDITGDNSPGDFDFKLPFAPGTHYRLNPDGSAAIVYKGRIFGTLAKPWAKDANGKMLPTHYSFNGSIIPQTVQLQGAAYPVVADPYAWWGWHGFMYWADDWTVNHYLDASTLASGIAGAYGNVVLVTIISMIAGVAAWCEGRSGTTFYFNLVPWYPYVQFAGCKGW